MLAVCNAEASVGEAVHARGSLCLNLPQIGFTSTEFVFLGTWWFGRKAEVAYDLSHARINAPAPAPTLITGSNVNSLRTTDVAGGFAGT
jgi:hypothetical protein